MVIFLSCRAHQSAFCALCGTFLCTVADYYDHRARKSSRDTSGDIKNGPHMRAVLVMVLKLDLHCCVVRTEALERCTVKRLLVVWVSDADEQLGALLH